VTIWHLGRSRGNRRAGVPWGESLRGVGAARSCVAGQGTEGEKSSERALRSCWPKLATGGRYISSGELGSCAGCWAEAGQGLTPGSQAPSGVCVGDRTARRGRGCRSRDEADLGGGSRPCACLDPSLGLSHMLRHQFLPFHCIPPGSSDLRTHFVEPLFTALNGSLVPWEGGCLLRESFLERRV
jgi:hypothetical protein